MQERQDNPTIRAHFGVGERELKSLFELNRSLCLSRMSESACDIVEYVSSDALLRLVIWRGGRPVRVPATIDDRGRQILDVLDEATARKLVKLLGGGYVDIPALRGIVAAMRPLVVAYLERDGLSESEIAGRLGIGTRSVRRMKGIARKSKVKLPELEPTAAAEPSCFPTHQEPVANDN